MPDATSSARLEARAADEQQPASGELQPDAGSLSSSSLVILAAACAVIGLIGLVSLGYRRLLLRKQQTTPVEAANGGLHDAEPLGMHQCTMHDAQTTGSWYPEPLLADKLPKSAVTEAPVLESAAAEAATPHRGASPAALSEETVAAALTAEESGMLVLPAAPRS